MSRTSVASSAMAIAVPSPSCWIDGTPVATNTAKTATMITAAELIVRALPARPSATARRVSPVAS